MDVIERQFNNPTSSTQSQLNSYSSSLQFNSSHTGGLITLKCKDFRQIRIKVSTNDDLINVSDAIESLSNLDDPRLFYPYFFPLNFVPLEDGWLTYDVQAEFNIIKSLNDEWRISNVNQNYAVNNLFNIFFVHFFLLFFFFFFFKKICSSYPESVIVPKTITDEMLTAISHFRCLGRFPVLSYFHKSNKVICNLILNCFHH